MTDIMAAEAEAEVVKPPLEDEPYRTTVRNVVLDAEHWFHNDIAPEINRAHRYYQGECDLEPQPNRSKFVMRVVRDVIEMCTPKVMEILMGAPEIVAFRAQDLDEQQQSMAQDATEAFNDLFFNKNPGWELTEDFVRSALKAKIGTFKVYYKDQIHVSEKDFQGTPEQFMAEALKEEVGVLEYREDMVPADSGIRDITTGQPIIVEKPQIAATLKYRKKNRKFCIETIAPEEWLIDRAATSLEPDCYQMCGQRTVKTVSQLVGMGIDYDTAVKHAGMGDNGAQGDYPDQIRRSRRSLSKDPYEETVGRDPASRPVTVYEVYVYVDRDQDGIAELRRVVALGDDFGEIVEDGIVDDNPYASSPAIAVEQSQIGESLADNVMDLQDIETQLSRQINDNMVKVNNPQIKAVRDRYDPDSVIDQKFGGIAEVESLDSLDWLVTPFIGDKALLIRESYNETRAERTGISKESQGLAAKNLQASSEVGVLAILGAGLTQPEMIAATIAHRAFVTLARKTIKMLQEEGESVRIDSSGTMKEVDPRAWPGDMRVIPRVGLGTGTREEKLAALNQVAARQERIITQFGPDNPICSVEQYAYTLHQITQLSNLGSTTSYFSTPELAKNKMKEISAQPKPPSPEEQKLQAEMQKAKLQSDTALQQTAMTTETQVIIQDMKDRIDQMEMLLEASLAAKKAEDEKLNSNDVNIQQGG